jgi:hypothetical protein
MTRRTIATAVAVLLGSAGLVVLLPPAPPATALGPAPTIRQFAGALATPYRAPDSLVKLGDALYITDDHGIDRVDLVTSSFALATGDRKAPGSTDGSFAAARFDNPSGIATDGLSLYLADTGNHTVRKLDPATQQVSTIAGSPDASGAVDAVGAAARFNRPRSVAVSVDGARLFVADEGNATVRTIDLATRQVTTLAGTPGQTGTTDGVGPAARFVAPRALDTDGNGLWVSDQRRIRKVLVDSATVTTFASVAYGQWDTITSISSSGTHLYVANRFDDDDDLYGELWQIDKATAAVEWFPGEGDTNSGVFVDGQTLFGAGELYATWAAVYEIDIPTRKRRRVAGFGARGAADGVGPAARFSFPTGMATDGTNLYVTDGVGVRKVTPSGAVTTLVRGLYGGADLATDGVNLYRTFGNQVRKIVLATGQESTLLTIGTPTQSAQGLALEGTSLFISSANCALYRYNLASGGLSVLSGYPGACAPVDGPATTARFVTGGPMGSHGDDLVILDQRNVLRRVDLGSGAVSTVADASDGLSYPDDVSTDGTYAYLNSFSTTDVRDPTKVMKVSMLTGEVTVLTGDAPLAYANQPASATRGGDCIPYEHELTNVIAMPGGHHVYFLNETGVGLITDAKVPPRLGIGDVRIGEGDGGTAPASFTVRLSSPQPKPVSVDYATADNGAVAGSDFVARSGSVSFLPGVVEKQVKVTVNGDTADEADERFKVVLSSPVGAVIGRGTGKGTILDDDPGGGVTLSVGDAKVVEGDDLGAKAVFPLRLSAPQFVAVTVNFGTLDGSATAAGGDYQARLATVTIPAGAASKNVSITINGDYAVEAVETFTLTISSPSSVTITRANGTGRISPDD